MFVPRLLLLACLGRGYSPASLSPTSRRELLGGATQAAVVAAILASRKGVTLAPSLVGDDDLFREEARRAATIAAKCVEDYERDGVAVARGVVSDFWIQLLRQGCEEAQDEPGPYSEYLGKATDPGIFFTDLELARRLSTFAAFALHGPAAAVAGAVTRSKEVRYLYDQLFLKESVSVPTPWHQDGGYWRVAGGDLCSVFVPLDVVPKSECLAFLPGTHSWPLYNPQHFADGTPYQGTDLPPMPDIEGGSYPSLQFDLTPGDVLIFSSRIVHGGHGNWGRALSTRWAGDDVHFWQRPGEGGSVPTGNLALRDGQSVAANPSAFPLAWHDS